MIKFLTRLFLTINFLLITQTSYSENTKGHGDVQLNEYMVEYFIQYIRGSDGKYPMHFFMTKDGFSYADTWYCPVGNSSCRSGSTKQDKQLCERNALKFSKKRHECFMFAKGRYIVWINDINIGGKQGKINSRWSDNEIRDKLYELGFYQNN
jgi:hypothetical protein